MDSRIPALRLPPAVSRVAAWIRPADDARELPLVHRLAVIYLMLPMVIWLVGWFEWWLGIPAAILLAAAFWQALCGSWRPSPRAAAIAILAVAACWMMATPAGGVLNIRSVDWDGHRTHLIELGRHPQPTFLLEPLAAYAPDEDYSPPLLRYYLGYFMPPGLAGHWLGRAALNWAVPIWTWIGVALVLLMFTRERRGWAVALAVLIFVFFGGMDILRIMLTGEWRLIDIQVEWDGLPGVSVERGHIEWRGLLGVVTQYSSNMTALMWVPQHFIPAGLYTFLMLQLRGHRRFLAVSGVLLAAAPFWSAFVAVGLLPLIAVLLWENGIRPFLRWPNLLLAVPLAAVTALYLTSGQTDFPSGWIWERHEWPLLVRWAPLFYLSEFLLLVILLWALRPNLRREPFFIACTAMLLLMPLYYFGASNVLLLRASLPPLLLLCYYCAETLSQRTHARTYSRGWYTVGIACMTAILAIGSVTALLELGRARDSDGRFRFEDWDHTPTLLSRWWQKENTAPHIPNMLRVLLDEDDIPPTYQRRGELIAQSKFDVYREEDSLVLVNYSGCREDDSEQFFLYAIPADRNDLPTETRALGLHYYQVSERNTVRTFGETCVARVPMPKYPVAGFRVGQRSQDDSVDWEASYEFDPHIDPLYRSLTSGDLIIRSQFDVYLDENRLIYVKEPCAQADTEHRFFLHVFPIDEADLPDDRRQYGFDNLDFGFGIYGIPIDDRCAAVRPLPDYGIATIATGQFTAAGEVWRDVYTFPVQESE